MSEATELVQMIRSALADEADDLLGQRATKAREQTTEPATSKPLDIPFVPFPGLPGMGD